MEFRFINDIPTSAINPAVNFLYQPRLLISNKDYPDYEPWIDQTRIELHQETKRAMVAYCDEDIVGVTIYQRHPTETTILQGENISVSPDMQGRLIANFLLRQTEIEGHNDFPETEIIIWDAKKRNTNMQAFFLGQGYTIREKTYLYGRKQGKDVVYQKRLTR